MALAAVALTAAGSTVFATELATAHDHTHAAAAAAANPDSASVSDTIQQMQAMHATMMVKTPAERAALMQKHMALMQSGMSMMQGMQGSSAKRMDMMQMMMDRMSNTTPQRRQAGCS